MSLAIRGGPAAIARPCYTFPSAPLERRGLVVMAKLVLSAADGVRRTVLLGTSPEPVTLGRDPSNDIVLSHLSISRHHARIVFEKGRYFIEDLDSRNRVFVAGKKIRKRRRLSPGDSIVLGLDGAHPVSFMDGGLEESQAGVRELLDFSSLQPDYGVGLRRLVRITEEITGSLESEEVYRLVLKGMLETSGGERAKIFLRGAGGELELAFQEEAATTASTGYSRSVLRRVVESRKPLLVNDVALDHELKGQESVHALDLHSVIGVPLFYSQRYLSTERDGDALMGVIYVDSRTARNRFTESDLGLLLAFSYQAAIAIENARLHRELRENYQALVASLAEAVELKDPYTRGHSDRVAAYSAAIAEAQGAGPADIEVLIRAGILHDIGKIGIDEEILTRPGKITDEEYLLVQQHTIYGARILEPLSHLACETDVVLHHHERLDGSGYPHGLKGNQIGPQVRVVAVADVFEALTADRSYRKALRPRKVIRILEDEAQSQLDPAAVEILLRLYHQAGHDREKIVCDMEHSRTIRRTFRTSLAYPKASQLI